MSDTSIDRLPTETLLQLESQCADVVATICRSLSTNAELVNAIRSLMRDNDTAWAIDSLRASDPDIANRIVIAAFGVLVNTINLTSIQDELQRRIRDSN